MKAIREPVKFLTIDEMEAIHCNTLRILAEVGMKIDHDEGLDYQLSVGCKVNREQKKEKFPKDVTQKYIKGFWETDIL
jgi:trimethylamine:corrinoid methyltransferase-like protein